MRKATGAITIIFSGVFVVLMVQILLNEATIKIAEAQYGSVPVSLWLGMLFTVAVHSALLCVIPVLLAAFKWVVTSYAALILLSAVYVTLMAGINVAAPVLFAIFVFVLTFYAFRKAREIYRYMKSGSK